MTGLMRGDGPVFHMGITGGGCNLLQAVLVAYLWAILKGALMTVPSHQAEARRYIANRLRRFTTAARGFFETGTLRYGTPLAQLLIVDSLDLQGFDGQVFKTEFDGVERAGIAGDWLSGHVLKVGHGNVDVLEDLARGNGDYAIGGLNEIVTFPTTVLAAEVVDEAKTGVELLGSD